MLATTEKLVSLSEVIKFREKTLSSLGRQKDQLVRHQRHSQNSQMPNTMYTEVHTVRFEYQPKPEK